MYNIVFPTNFAKQNQRVIVEFINNFTTAVNEEVNYYVLHAYQTPQVGQHVMLDLDENLKKNAHEDMAKFIGEINQKINKETHIKPYIRRGNIESTLHKFDNEVEINLVVLVETKNSAFKELLSEKNLSDLSRSLAELILYIPTKPEYIIPKKITLATDLQPFNNYHDFKNFLGFVKNSGASLDFIHVNNQDKDFETDFKAIFEESLAEYSINAKLKVLKGNNINKTIKNYIETEKPQIITVIEREGSIFNRWFKKQTVDSLSDYNKLPVFVISENAEVNE